MKTKYLAVSIHDQGNELAAAECQRLTGARPDENARAFCDSIDLIPQAAYVRYGARRIIETESFEALTGWLRRVRFRATDFHIKSVALSGEGQASSRRLTVAIADAIEGRPNLDHPRQRFLLLAGPRTFWFGEITMEATRRYREHDAKPCHATGTLDARLARGLVNLVAPTAGSLLNPCCGTGSILLEACALGLEAHGADWSPRMTGMANQNLAHFNYSAPVEQIDARLWTRKADALIADLPYGRGHPFDEAAIFELLHNAASLAPVAVFVAGKDISAALRRAGYREIEIFRVRNSGAFSRYVHSARSARLR